MRFKLLDILDTARFWKWFSFILLLFFSASLVSYHQTNKSLKAYEVINEERGTVLISEDDKKFVTFRLRANSGMAFETNGLSYALKHINDIGDVKGVSIDGVLLSVDTLHSLNNLSTLEKINLKATGLNDYVIQEWLNAWMIANPNKPRPILQ